LELEELLQQNLHQFVVQIMELILLFLQLLLLVEVVEVIIAKIQENLVDQVVEVVP